MHDYKKKRRCSMRSITTVLYGLWARVSNDDIPSRKTIGFSGGFGSSPAAPITMNVCPFALRQSLANRTSGACMIESFSTYLLGAHFLPVCIILTDNTTSAYGMHNGVRRTYLQHTALYHDLHTVWRNARYLVYRILECGWRLIWVELHLMDLSCMFDLDCEGCHYFTNMFSGLRGEGKEEGVEPPDAYASFCPSPISASSPDARPSLRTRRPTCPGAPGGLRGEKGKVPAGGRQGGMTSRCGETWPERWHGLHAAALAINRHDFTDDHHLPPFPPTQQKSR